MFPSAIYLISFTSCADQTNMYKSAIPECRLQNWLKFTLFWDVTPCGLVDSCWRFRDRISIHSLHTHQNTICYPWRLILVVTDARISNLTIYLKIDLLYSAHIICFENLVYPCPLLFLFCFGYFLIWYFVTHT